MSDLQNEYILYHNNRDQLESLMIATLEEHSNRNKGKPGEPVLYILKQSFFRVGSSFTYTTLVRVELE